MPPPLPLSSSSLLTVALRSLTLPRSLPRSLALPSPPPTRALSSAPPVLSYHTPSPTDPHLATRTSATQKQRWATDVDGAPIRTASARRLGISTSPHKLNLVARLVRGLSVDEARRQLTGSLKKHSEHVREAIDSAVVNARSFGMVEERLVVSRAFVNKGKYLKRLRPWHGKGRFGIEEKKYTHLCVEVKEVGDEVWEATVLPQYMHMRFKPRANERKRCLPDVLVKPWTVRSQMEVSYLETKRRTEAIQAQLPKKRHPFPKDFKPFLGR